MKEKGVYLVSKAAGLREEGDRDRRRQEGESWVEVVERDREVGMWKGMERELLTGKRK